MTWDDTKRQFSPHLFPYLIPRKVSHYAPAKPFILWHHRSATTRQEREAEMRAEEKRGQILITDFIQEWIASNPGLTETTRAHYGNVFKNRHEASLAGVTLTDLSPERCKQWWREIRNEFPTTKKRNKAVLDLLKSTLTGVFLYSLSTLWVWVAGAMKMSGLLPWCCFAGMGSSRLGFPSRLCCE